MADSSTNILKQHIMCLSKRQAPKDAGCVLYIMSRDQRVKDNLALLAAQKHANALKLPLTVVFLLYHASGFRAREHFEYMLGGLKLVGTDLAKQNISFKIIDSESDSRACVQKVIKELAPASVYLDFNPLHGPSALRNHIAQVATCSVYVVDTHNTVPVWVTSDKQEIAARTIRPKIHSHLPAFLIEHQPIIAHPYGTGTDTTSYDSLQKVIGTIKSNRQILTWKPGEAQAYKEVNSFIANRLKDYVDKRNDPSFDHQSNLSPYLHYGQIASRRVALMVQQAVQADPSLSKGAGAFLEELLVRGELADNFCWYNPHYIELKGAPQWAQNTLAKHSADPREFIYSYIELEKAKTHDPAWNAAQTQLLKHGKMHGYMRMYWAKKVLEWTTSPEDALRTLVQLNDHYTIDGGDPNGYVGIMWSVAGVHDRPWGERPVYGVVRSMVYNGLKRKFDIEAYQQQWLKS